MPKRSAKDGFARVQELAAFDQEIALSFLAESTSATSSGVFNVSRDGLEQTINANPPTAQLPSLPSLAGFDEAGRGALAGPVVVGCVHFPSMELSAMPRVTSERISAVSVTPPTAPMSDLTTARADHSILRSISGLDDSKRLTARQREELCPRIKASCMWGVGAASAGEIDKLGIVPAVSLAARRAYRAMGMEVAVLLCDRGITLGDMRGHRDAETQRQRNSDRHPLKLGEAMIGPLPASLPFRVSSSLPLPSSAAFPPELAFTRGDSRSLHIAAASIIAKVTRDHMMIDLDQHWPGYDFAVHKGYGTAAHISALRKLGPSRVHRRSFHVK